MTTSLTTTTEAEESLAAATMECEGVAREHSRAGWALFLEVEGGIVSSKTFCVTWTGTGTGGNSRRAGLVIKATDPPARDPRPTVRAPLTTPNARYTNTASELEVLGARHVLQARTSWSTPTRERRFPPAAHTSDASLVLIRQKMDARPAHKAAAAAAAMETTAAVTAAACTRYPMCTREAIHRR
jgi:hypothetical protein